MVRIFKVLVWIFLSLCVLIALAATFVYYLAGRSIPDYNRDFTVEGAEGRIEIVRANYAIPHIFAEFETDAYFGLGFVHAQDRMWQMLMLRRAAQGRLSEIFGTATLKTDRLMRTLDLYQVAVDAVTFQNPETRAILERYAAGVNAYLKAVRTEALGRGTPELWLFSPELAPWTPADSIAVLKLMALQLSDKAATEIRQAQLALLLPPERLADLYPEDQGEAVMALPEFAAYFDDLPNPIETYEPQIEHAFYPLSPPGFAGASNAWAVAPKRSAAGGTLMAADPHLKLTAPSIWMLARLQLDGGGVIGATIPGVPAILQGRNSDFAWGLTTSYLDDQDLFIEKLNPDDPGLYLTPAGYRRFETKDVIINIKDAPGITLNVRKSRHGPILDPEHMNIASILPKGHVAALGWTGLDPNDRSIEGAINLMKVRKIVDAEAPLSLVHAAAVNVMMIDKDAIAMQAAGRAPVRDPMHTSKGRIPAPGWLAQNDWNGYAPFETNPLVISPPSGVIANTNNRIIDRQFPDHWSFDWGDNQRIRRATRMLNNREFHTLDSLIEIQTDTVSPTARTLLPLIARDLWYSGAPAAEGTVERRRQDALELLANWTGDMSEHDPEPLLYAAWTRALQRRLLVDEIGPLSNGLNSLQALFIERVYRDKDGASAWCDVIQTSRVETCTEIARSALDEALQTLIEAHGPRMASWQWGRIHQAVQRHEVLGNLPMGSFVANIVQDTPGGDNTLLRGQMIGFGDKPFQSIHGSGYRGVYDMADPEASVFIISTGQSGHFLSRHYDDLSQIWRRSEYIPMTLDPVLARGGNRGITILTPQPE